MHVQFFTGFITDTVDILLLAAAEKLYNTEKCDFVIANGAVHVNFQLCMPPPPSGLRLYLYAHFTHFFEGQVNDPTTNDLLAVHVTICPDIFAQRQFAGARFKQFKLGLHAPCTFRGRSVTKIHYNLINNRIFNYMLARFD